MKRTSVLVITALLLTVRLAWADCGAIPFKRNVLIFEPNQRAVIGFNGREEVLVLSTDLSSSEPTKILQVLPLPSEPKVTKADAEIFMNATNLINRKINPHPGGGAGAQGMGGLGAGRPTAPPAGEVTFHDRIGSHEISVAHVLDRRGFVDWVEKYLRKSGVDTPAIPEPMKAVVAEYIRDKFVWFVFDVVELSKETKTKDAVQYRFPTPFLYYPLRITRTEEGDTLVRLLVVSPELLPLPKSVHLAHKPVQISALELASLGNRDVSKLFVGPSCMLRIWEIRGPLSGFKKDLMVTPR